MDRTVAGVFQLYVLTTPQYISNKLLERHFQRRETYINKILNFVINLCYVNSVNVEFLYDHLFVWYTGTVRNPQQNTGNKLTY